MSLEAEYKALKAQEIEEQRIEAQKRKNKELKSKIFALKHRKKINKVLRHIMEKVLLDTMYDLPSMNDVSKVVVRFCQL